MPVVKSGVPAGGGAGSTGASPRVTAAVAPATGRMRPAAALSGIPTARSPIAPRSPRHTLHAAPTHPSQHSGRRRNEQSLRPRAVGRPASRQAPGPAQRGNCSERRGWRLLCHQSGSGGVCQVITDRASGPRLGECRSPWQSAGLAGANMATAGRRPWRYSDRGRRSVLHRAGANADELPLALAAEQDREARRLPCAAPLLGAAAVLALVDSRRLIGRATNVRPRLDERAGESSGPRLAG